MTRESDEHCCRSNPSQLVTTAEMRNRENGQSAAVKRAAERLSRPGALCPLACQHGLKHVQDAPLPLAGQ